MSRNPDYRNQVLPNRSDIALKVLPELVHNQLRKDGSIVIDALCLQAFVIADAFLEAEQGG